MAHDTDDLTDGTVFDAIIGSLLQASQFNPNDQTVPAYLTETQWGRCAIIREGNKIDGGRHFLRFKAAQSNAHGQRRDQDFRVAIDGKLVGVFEPPLNSPCLMMTRVFDVTDGPHKVTFTGLNTAGASVAQGDNICLIDCITIVEPE